MTEKELTFRGEVVKVSGGKNGSTVKLRTPVKAYNAFMDERGIDKDTRKMFKEATNALLKEATEFAAEYVSDNNCKVKMVIPEDKDHGLTVTVNNSRSWEGGTRKIGDREITIEPGTSYGDVTWGSYTNFSDEDAKFVAGIKDKVKKALS